MTVSEEKQATNITVIYHREIRGKKLTAIPGIISTTKITGSGGDPSRQAGAPKD